MPELEPKLNSLERLLLKDANITLKERAFNVLQNLNVPSSIAFLTGGFCVTFAAYSFYSWYTEPHNFSRVLSALREVNEELTTAQNQSTYQPSPEILQPAINALSAEVQKHPCETTETLESIMRGTSAVLQQNDLNTATEQLDLFTAKVENIQKYNSGRIPASLLFGFVGFFMSFIGYLTNKDLWTDHLHNKRYYSQKLHERLPSLRKEILEHKYAVHILEFSHTLYDRNIRGLQLLGFVEELLKYKKQNNRLAFEDLQKTPPQIKHIYELDQYFKDFKLPINDPEAVAKLTKENKILHDEVDILSKQREADKKTYKRILDIYHNLRKGNLEEELYTLAGEKMPEPSEQTDIDHIIERFKRIEMD